jgi:hypothetical protein
MKRFISVLSSLLVLPAFAEVAPVYYDEVIEYTDDMIDVMDAIETDELTESNVQQNVAQRPVINRSTSASRAVSSGTGTSSRTNASSRAVASSPRTTTTGASRATTSRTTKTPAVAQRSTAQRASRTAVTSRNAQTTKPVTARIGIASTNSVLPATNRTNSASVNVLQDSGTPLYNSNSSRVGVGNRRASARLAATVTPVTTTTTITQEDVSSTTNNLTAIAELTEYCKAQYAACMDNYCNVLDDNQGRCSCSKNLKNYEKTEAALAQATEDFQDVVQKIKYIGLSGDQIESLFTETEAELSMKSNSDSSRLKTSLDAIKKKIVDVSTPSATSSTLNSGISLDLNGLLSADFTSGFDLNSFLGSTGTNTNSVSNQRGEQLYKTAANRCKTAVLNSCTTQGIDANVITNSYDLEIDKQCIAYERSLNEANSEMKNNVTNATTILQQARLLLAQNRNSYDLRSCVAAIDSCMQDEYICGSDYELCLDPTGKYLANGEIVKGGTPGVSGGQPRTSTKMCTATAGTESGEICDANNPCPADQTCNSNNECVYASYCVTKDNWGSEGMYNLYSAWDYKDATNTSTVENAWSFGTNETLGEYINYHLTNWKTNYTKSKDTNSASDMATYLLQKIGYIDSNDKVHGMCASVMKQCQDYTFNTKKTNKNYIPDNEVVRQYLNSTLAKIKVKQDEILNDYAEGCRADVQSCLSTNGYEETNPSSTASKTAVNACASEITTCMSVGGYQVTEGVKLTLRAMTDWVASILLTCNSGDYLVDNGTTTSCAHCPDVPVVRKNSNCSLGPNTECPYELWEIDPDTGLYQTGGTQVYVKTISSGGRVTECSCPEGYENHYALTSDGFGVDAGSLVCYDPSKDQ